ncbi:MAG: hypothetical protein RL151_1160 [Bacteroidota bacterium]
MVITARSFGGLGMTAGGESFANIGRYPPTFTVILRPPKDLAVYLVN